MADIFVSYASKDRQRIQPLVRALEATGWSVFWDRRIPTGKTWRQVIGAEIGVCRSVMVVWSEASIDSTWVQEEAEEGKKRQVLYPVLIDAISQPFGFTSVQAADLSDWDGSPSAAVVRSLIDDLSLTLGPLPVAVTEVQAEAPPPTLPLKPAPTTHESIADENEPVDRSIEADEGSKPTSPPQPLRAERDDQHPGAEVAPSREGAPPHTDESAPTDKRAAPTWLTIGAIAGLVTVSVFMVDLVHELFHDASPLIRDLLEDTSLFGAIGASVAFGGMQWLGLSLLDVRRLVLWLLLGVAVSVLLRFVFELALGEKIVMWCLDSFILWTCLAFAALRGTTGLHPLGTWKSILCLASIAGFGALFGDLMSWVIRIVLAPDNVGDASRILIRALCSAILWSGLAGGAMIGAEYGSYRGQALIPLGENDTPRSSRQMLLGILIVTGGAFIATCCRYLLYDAVEDRFVAAHAIAMSGYYGFLALAGLLAVRQFNNTPRP